MTLQSAGKISALDIIVEEAIHPEDSLGMDTAKSRNLAKRSTGQIAYSDFYGKSSVVPACQDFTSSTVFQIPAYNYMLTIQVWGAGGSGGNSNSNLAPAAPGGYTRATLNGGYLTGYGGQGGQNQLSWTGPRGHYNGYGGAGGNADGGDINTTGGAGAAGQSAVPGKGGDSPNGGAGGVGRYPVGVSGGYPGGGGGGTGEGYGSGKFSWDCGGGGAGGYAGKTILKGSAFAPAYSNATIVIGASGQGVATYGTEKGGDGGAGLCRICWDMGALTALPAGTYLASFCSGYNLYHTLADGNNGTYNQLIESNSTSCGYVVPVVPTITYTFASYSGDNTASLIFTISPQPAAGTVTFYGTSGGDIAGLLTIPVTDLTGGSYTFSMTYTNNGSYLSYAVYTDASGNIITSGIETVWPRGGGN